MTKHSQKSGNAIPYFTLLLNTLKLIALLVFSFPRLYKSNLTVINAYVALSTRLVRRRLGSAVVVMPSDTGRIFRTSQKGTNDD